MSLIKSQYLLHLRSLWKTHTTRCWTRKQVTIFVPSVFATAYVMWCTGESNVSNVEIEFGLNMSGFQSTDGDGGDDARQQRTVLLRATGVKYGNFKSLECQLQDVTELRARQQQAMVCMCDVEDMQVQTVLS